MVNWCEQLILRLPELEWRLQTWPVGYKKRIPAGLFQNQNQLTPELAFNELRHHLLKLQQMDEASNGAKFLAEKIAKQIDVLVELGKTKVKNTQLQFQPGLTRKQHLQRLNEKKQHLLDQEKALILAFQRLSLPVIQDEIITLQQQLQQISNMLARI